MSAVCHESMNHSTDRLARRSLLWISCWRNLRTVWALVSPACAAFQSSGGRAPDVGARADSGHSLLLWGGLDDDGDPVLEPAFVVNAPPVLPPAGGAYRLRGLTASGEELFALGFDMLEASDGGAPSLVFALPARPEWEGSLARITLSGPAGSVSLDGRGGPSMTIAQDARTGRVRGILRGDGARSGVGDAEAAAAVGADAVAESGFVVLFSRGVPGEGW